jgi:hypothetical protein
MTDLQLELIELIGKKDLSFGCLVKKWKDIAKVIYENHYDIDVLIKVRYEYSYQSSYNIDGIEIIWHPATLSDLHRWMNENRWKDVTFYQTYTYIDFTHKTGKEIEISYDSSKDLLDQSEETLTQIIDLIKKYS